jgi:isopentenyl-diphosphate delta-isomerase
MEEKVILVDSNDNSLGLMEKMKAHELGFLHRAFSVFIFNSQAEMMLQQRAHSKYHSGGLWTNTCCSHPREGETVEQAGLRRLREEMGFETELIYGFSFIYKAILDDGLIEHELDHVLIGFYDGQPSINTDEVQSWRWVSFEQLKSDIETKPNEYTAWFKIILNNHGQQIVDLSQSSIVS